jgi:hypothetical protein
VSPIVYCFPFAWVIYQTSNIESNQSFGHIKLEEQIGWCLLPTLSAIIMEHNHPYACRLLTHTRLTPRFEFWLLVGWLAAMRESMSKILDRVATKIEKTKKIQPASHLSERQEGVLPVSSG